MEKTTNFLKYGTVLTRAEAKKIKGGWVSPYPDYPCPAGLLNFEATVTCPSGSSHNVRICGTLEEYERDRESMSVTLFRIYC